MQAEQAADQAKAAATAYETAFAETVPPPVVSANRSMLAALAATNASCRNPAIAATEIPVRRNVGPRYRRDVRLRGFFGVRDHAEAITPPPVEHQPGWAGRGRGAATSQGRPPGNAQNVVSSAQQAFAAVPAALSNLASAAPTAAAESPLTLLDLASDLIAIFFDLPASVAGLNRLTSVVDFLFPSTWPVP